LEEIQAVFGDNIAETLEEAGEKVVQERKGAAAEHREEAA